MRRQLRRLGLGHDTRREIATTDLTFYRWTQWIFLKIFNSWCDERTGRARPIEELISEFTSGQRPAPDGRPWGELTAVEQRRAIDAHRLAYISEELVNWCPGLGTVLANEEVTADGRSDVGNYPVYRRALRQWMLRITAFAERLIDDLDLVDWPESIKLMQRNWIGASGGAYINLPVAGQSDLSIQVFTTAAIDWLQAQNVGNGTRSYRLRDWLFSRQRYWGEPFPIVYDEHGLPIPLPEDALPVRLPEMPDVRSEPQEDETSDPVPPLAKAKDWSTVELDLGDGVKPYQRELNTMPQRAGSCWYFLRYLDPVNDRAFVDPDVERYWMAAPHAALEGEGGVDLYVGGVEHAVLHLLYARFWHKVLYDLGYVSTKEPFRRLYNQGYILADAFTDQRGMYVPAAEVVKAAGGTLTYAGQPVTRRAGKMGKSLKNSVSPDEMYARYGADTLRLYEMAMGPLDTDRPWRTNDIVGVNRFLQRLWRAIIDETTGKIWVSDQPLDHESLQRLHRTIMIVRKDFEGLRFNTAIARLMELTSHAINLAADNAGLPRAMAEPLVLMVAPLAPHVAEELWTRLGHGRR